MASNEPLPPIEGDDANDRSQGPSRRSTKCYSSRPGLSHRNSRVSRVSIDYFDPEGFQELRAALDRIASLQLPPMTLTQSRTDESDKVSDITLAVGEGDFDIEKSLRLIVKKRADSHIKTRELGVYFENLRVVGLGAAVSWQPTLASFLNPLAIISHFRRCRHPPVRNILSGFEGVLRPGEMLLVLGSPGSGCSTFLKTLTNQRSEYHAVEGTVHYDSISHRDLARHYRGDVQYCPEDDVHFPTLTVDETILFATKTRAPRVRLDDQSREEYARFMTDVYTTIFGLRHVKNTPVGDAAIRGVSGGEKKRVSIAEALANRSLINAWDNSTRGLDSSTAVEFVHALRIATDIGRLSTIVSIYQAGESLYEMFDKVCVIYEGKMAYYGPASEARQYFIDMGYEPANRQTTPEFLVAVTDPLGRIPRKVDTDEKVMILLPKTAEEFADYFKKSAVGIANKEDMESYRYEHVGHPEQVTAYKESALAEQAKNACRQSPYTMTVGMQVRSVMTRRIQIIKGNWTALLLSTLTLIIQAIIIGTVFLKTPGTTSAFYGRGGILFFGLFLPCLVTTSEIPALFVQRPIILRHQKAAMYHPFIEALALTLVDIPVTFITTILYSVVLYYLIQLQQSAGQFFIFFLVVFTVSVAMKAFFRGLAAAFGSEAPAQTVAGVVLLALVLYTGYSLPMPTMIGALKWITYINPLRYAFEALVTNEFHTINAPCAQLVPSGPGYEQVSLSNQVCTTIGSIPGQADVDGNRFVEMAYGYSVSHLWRNYGIIIAFGVLFLIVLLVFTELNTGLASQTSVVLFKYGSKAGVAKRTAPARGDDEEKSQHSVSYSGDVDERREAKAKARANARKSLASQPKMTDIFSWQHVNYTVPVGHNEHRRLLDDVSGYVAPKKLTALMGESGAGKTTLLNVLAQRTGTGVISGDRFVNGQPLPKDFQAKTGYCQQMDVHLPTTTVREALLFSAMTRQPQEVPAAEKGAYVEQCLRMCALEPYADAIVGSLGVEHRKRTTIGVELAAKPKLLLFLDEPTSGLDSESARAIVAFLRDLADHGQAILCTIHQPSAELFQVFDRLLLLKKGGKTVYFGDLGPNATTLIDYFERNGSRPCMPDENPAEFMLDVIGAGATATSKQDWHQKWIESKECQQLQVDIERIHSEGRLLPPVAATLHSDFATSWLFQCKILLLRNFSSYWRDPTYLMAKLVLNVVGGLFIGFTFWNSKNTLQGTQNKLFAIFMPTILSAPLGGQLQVPFINLRDIYEIREKPSRMYHWSALITSQILVEVPWNVLGSCLFFVCWYWTVGFESSRAGYMFLMYGVTFPIYYTTIAQAVGSMAPTAEIAGVLFSFIFSFAFTFNGVLQPFAQLGWWQWMYHVSPLTYLTEGLVGQAVGHQEISCSPVELATLEPPSGSTCASYLQQYITSNGGYLTNPDATSGCLYCVSRTTDEYLGPSFNIFYSNHWRDFGLLAAYIVFNVFLVYLLTYLFRVRSPSSLVSGLKKRFARRNV